MGRGLSELQRRILLRAHQGRAARTPGDRNAPDAPDVFHHELLVSVYGWRSEASFANHGGHHFSREKIGAAKYRSDLASLSRSITRLVERGLVTRGGRNDLGINLTLAGVVETSLPKPQNAKSPQ